MNIYSFTGDFDRRAIAAIIKESGGIVKKFSLETRVLIFGEHAGSALVVAEFHGIKTMHIIEFFNQIHGGME